MAFDDLMSAADSAILSALGVTATLVTDTGIRLGAIAGVLDSDYVDVSGVEGRRPIFTVRTADVPEDCHDYRLVMADGVTYTVDVPKPDGTGMTALVLKDF